jgi:hypothetical protein
MLIQPRLLTLTIRNMGEFGLPDLVVPHEQQRPQPALQRAFKPILVDFEHRFKHSFSIDTLQRCLEKKHKPHIA